MEKEVGEWERGGKDRGRSPKCPNPELASLDKNGQFYTRYRQISDLLCCNICRSTCSNYVVQDRRSTARIIV